MTRPARIAPAPYAEHRCVRSSVAAALGGDLAAVQAAHILDLDGRLHKLANRVTAAEGTLELIRVALHLPEDAPSPAILERVQKLAMVTEDRDALLEVIESITLAVKLPTGTEPHKVLQRIEEIA